MAGGAGRVGGVVSANGMGGTFRAFVEGLAGRQRPDQRADVANPPPILMRESMADCVVKVLVPAEFVFLFDPDGLWVEGDIRLVREGDGYALEIRHHWATRWNEVDP